MCESVDNYHIRDVIPTCVNLLACFLLVSTYLRDFYLRYSTLRSTHVRLTCVYPTYVYRRTRDARQDVDTDTDSTSEEDNVGGLGKFSHGWYGLVHQHWVDQIISAGSFGLHNTEAPEAYHKTCMKLASMRVRHLHDSKTKQSMLMYVWWNFLFCEMDKDVLDETPRPSPINFFFGLRKILHMDLERIFVENHFLHREALITRSELFDLLCQRFGVPSSAIAHGNLTSLGYVFGQQLCREDGKVFWATDTRYPYGSSGQRRDILRIHGTENVAGTTNALYCEATVFVRVHHVASLPFYREVTTDLSDTMTFVIGRWFSPHPSTHSIRDSEHRPLCPGACNVNHCLWTYARTNNPRASMTAARNDVLRSQIKMFGATHSIQQRNLRLHSHSYMCLLDVDTIDEVVNGMCFQFDGLSSNIDTTSWLQTVTVL